jgi:hypothetical protein
MKNMNGHRVGPLRLMFVLTVYAFSVPFSLFPQRKTEESKERLALVGGQIYPGPFSRPISDGVVLIENGKITTVGQKGRVHVPPDFETIDCAGRTISAASGTARQIRAALFPKT